MAELKSALASVTEDSNASMSASRALEWLDVLGETFAGAELPEEKSDLVHAVYESITVAGPDIVSVRLTPSAYGHGLALALPEAVMARPTGVGRALTAHRMPIEGRDEWIAAASRQLA
jgi:hypothetical protein